ncbi:hypothetical protein HO133_001433 [Letharia lupina]|uniref:F-box domain-containing protein n=1 Tax=Letharia lupina TaxID=560253 RepID=A0A8H6CF55_9LECA|nr:uncharacterized protein HO133_001433 [Letharia lupina]KAF6222347.1 hypothetical protein HO133_001433 [Letharia lupina]
MAPTIALTDLPSDILYSIFPYLSATDFLRFTTVTKALHTYHQDPTFWHALTRATFRIPDQPLLQGARWQWLYKKLLTQTRLYTWGDNKSGNLGHDNTGPQSQRLSPRAAVHGRAWRTEAGSAGWPKQPVISEDVGIVADVQCGGWSTTILNSIGAIYIYGIFDGLRSGGGANLRRLSFPHAYPTTSKTRSEPSTAIQQYSTGRSSVLGLSDDGKVWMWESVMGFQIKLAHVDMVGNKVDRVIAGWDRNSMYVIDVGIVYWASVQDSDVVRGGRQETLAVADTMLVDSVTIPGTSYRRKRYNGRTTDDGLESRIGQVTHHIVLENWIVFTTDLNRVFCYPTIFPMRAFNIPEPIELTTFPTACPSETFRIRDLQGSFIRFAVFTTSGAILTADKDLLNAFHHASTSHPVHPLPSPVLLHSPPSNPIISLAYGDHHYHALHSTGTITSYGLEPQRCGALGLGNRLISHLRGVALEGGAFGGGRISPALNPTVWFEPLMQTWLQDMDWASGQPEARERGRMVLSGHVGACEATGRYFERKGACWEDGITREDEMGAYFVLKVASAGWHSAALVLVDDYKAEAAKKSHLARPPSPAPSRAASIQSVDTQGFAYEVIDSPGEQLIIGIRSVGHWFWDVGRWFLGLTARDEARKRQAGRTEREGRSPGEREREAQGIVYEWSKEHFPRLRMEGGEAMPGEVEVME